MIFDRVKKIIAEQLDIEESEIRMDDTFESLGDSLDLFEIIIEIEEQFDIKIEEAEEIKTVGDAVRFIENYK